MKLLTTLLICTLFAPQVPAQDTLQPDVTHVTRITFFQPGFSYEHRVGRMQTFYVNPFLATLVGVSYSSNLGFDAPIELDPVFLVHYRFYYNGVKRAEKGKRTDMNSMNYFTPMAQVRFSRRARLNETMYQFRRQADYGVGALWGMQRNYGRRFSLDLNAGIGYYLWNDVMIHSGEKFINWHSEFSPTIQFSLGFWLNKK